MRLDYLKMFCDVARCRSFSEAAQMNRVSQSAVSQVVLQIEKRLGVQLFDRSTRPLQLTSEGRAYYDGCRNLIQQFDALEASIGKLHDRVTASVQIAAIYSVGLRDMNQYIDKFKALWPGSSVHIEYVHPERVYQKVAEGSVDLGLVSYPRKSREIVALKWRDETMVLACSPRHPLARLARIEMSQLNGVRYIGFDRELTIRKHIDRFFRKHHVVADVMLEFDNIENVKKAIEETAGVALLPEPMLRREVESGLLIAVPLADCQLVRPLGIIYRRHHQLTPAAQDFLKLLWEPDAQGPLTSGSRGNASTSEILSGSVRGRDHLT